jgi:hypothetical protein
VVPVEVVPTGPSVNTTWCHLPSPIVDTHVPLPLSTAPLIVPSTQPLELTQSVGGFPPLPVPVENRVPALVALYHSSTDSPAPPVPAKYPPGMLICEPLPVKPAAVPSGKPVGPATPSVTLA